MFIKKSIFFLLFFCFSYSSHCSENSETSSLEEIDIEDFFRKAVIDDITISPNGDMIAYEKFGAIMVGNVDTSFTEISAGSNGTYVTDIKWVGDNVLVIEKNTKTRHWFSIYELDIDKNSNKFIVLRKQFIKQSGYIVDPLIDDSENILFALYKFKNDKVYSDVFKISLFDDKRKSLRKHSRINKYNDQILYWLTDETHKLTIGISYHNDIPTLWHAKGRRKKLEKIWNPRLKVEFRPYKITNDNKLWVLTNWQHDKLIAAQFNLKSHTIDKIFHEKSNVDLKNIILGKNTNKPLAVTYLDKGQYKYEFLDKEALQNFETLRKKFPEQNIHVIETSNDRIHQLIITTSNSKAGSFSVCTVADFSCKSISSLFPWLDSVNLATTKSFTIKTNDNFEIESFITIPKNTTDKTIPLIVMPHGGPIGISDNSYFSGDVQWLAFNGYAVLQVNYRGSGGYGNKFEFSGMQQWGRAIEDDIEDALKSALAQNPSLDAKRVCLFGASYGGYSAIMGIIRSPEKYRCAVSFAGVTDLPLLFNKNSIKNNISMTNTLKKIIGDPEKQMKELMEFSPTYQYKKITKPLMLIHGNNDKTVDIEHSWRLRILMELKNIPHEWVFMEDVGHGFTHTGQIKTMYDKIMPFLEKNLALD